jgi:hypothetical protein
MTFCTIWTRLAYWRWTGGQVMSLIEAVTTIPLAVKAA